MNSILHLYKGRINRSTFFGGWLLFVLSVIVLSGVALFATDGLSKGNAIVIIVLVVALIMLYIYLFSIVARRLHDVNLSGWMSLLMIIGPINLLMVIALSLVKGDEKDNKYGTVPHKQFDIGGLFK